MASRADTMPEQGAADALIQNFRRVRGTSVALIDTLEPEDCVIQTIPEVSPTKWHLAHITWFFEQFVLGPQAPGYRVFDERYAYIFNSYYSPTYFLTTLLSF